MEDLVSARFLLQQVWSLIIDLLQSKGENRVVARNIVDYSLLVVLNIDSFVQSTHY